MNSIFFELRNHEASLVHSKQRQVFQATSRKMRSAPMVQNMNTVIRSQRTAIMEFIYWRFTDAIVIDSFDSVGDAHGIGYNTVRYTTQKARIRKIYDDNTKAQHPIGAHRKHLFNAQNADTEHGNRLKSTRSRNRRRSEGHE